MNDTPNIKSPNYGEGYADACQEILAMLDAAMLVAPSVEAALFAQNVVGEIYDAITDKLTAVLEPAASHISETLVAQLQEAVFDFAKALGVEPASR